MPWKVIKNKDGSYRVKNMDTKQLRSKDTTLSNATKQINLLRYISAMKHEKFKK